MTSTPSGTLARRVRTRLAGQGLSVARVVPLARASQAPVFRVHLDDGRIIKVRVYGSPRAAVRVWALLGVAGESVTARRILLAGRMIVTDFVDGVPLDRHLRNATSTAVTHAIRAAGTLLAELHSRRVSKSGALGMASYRVLLRRSVNRLVRRSMLSPDAADRLLELETPRTPLLGLTHGDACPENLIVTRHGLRVIDEERMAVRPVAFDLARTVTRWPLTRNAEATLLAAYERAGGRPEGFTSHRAFWIAFALASTASYRLRFELPGVARTVAKMRSLSQTLQES